MSFTNLIPTLLRSNAVTPSTQDCKPASATSPVQRPWHEIIETAEAWALTVHLPGVSKENLEFFVDNNEVRVVGRKKLTQATDSTLLYRESNDYPYELVISHENAVDAERIQAELKDGILQASLPKTAAIKPRKISVG